jgi:redox-sensitive bicupin YhaK (pirin superfamily)
MQESIRIAIAADLKARGSRLFGLQTWVALPAVHEETESSFAHYEETNLPVLEAEFGLDQRLDYS